MVIASICLLSHTSYAQNFSASGITIEFVRPQSEGSVSEVASNVLKVINKSGRRSVFSLEVSTPAQWLPVGASNKMYNVANNDSLFIPVRVIPDKAAKGNVNYFINATAITAGGVPLASAPWSMKIVKVSNWFASLIENEVYFPSDQDIAEFKVRVGNQGNSAEQVVVLFTPDSKVSVLDANGNPFADNSFNLSLPVGLDSTFTFQAVLGKKEEKKNFFTADPIDQETQGQTSFKVHVQVKDAAGDSRSWGGRIDLNKLGTEKKFESNLGSSSIPLKVEFNTFNVLSQFTNFSLDLSGETDLGNDRHARYYYQTIISSNGVAGTQFLGAYRFGEFRTKNYTVAAGDIGANMELLLNGVGVKGQYRFDKVDVSAIFAHRPQAGNVQNNLNSLGASARYKSGERWNAEVQLVNQGDEFNQVSRNLLTVGGDYRFPNNSTARIQLGYSAENHDTDRGVFTKPGLGLKANYTGKIKGVSVSSQLRYNTANFSSQFRGTKGFNTNARYNLNDKYYVGLRLNMNTRDADIYSKGFLFPRRFFKQNTYEAQLGWNSPSGNFILFPRFQEDEVLDVRTTTTGMGLSFSTNRNADFRIFSRFFSGFTKALDYEVKPYLVYRWENTLRWKNLNMSARYYFGPFNVLDNLRVVEDGLNPQSVFISVFSQLNFTKARVSVRPMITIAYESVLARWRANVAPRFSYFSASGLEFNMTLEHFNINQGDSPLGAVSENGIQAFRPFRQSNTFLRFGIIKHFNIKKPGNKVHDMEVVVFRDTNGNNKLDQGENLQKNVLVAVNGEYLMTDNRGKVKFKNLERREYLVRTEMLSNEEGWFKGKTLTIDLDNDRTVYLPLKKGVQIDGSIILQKAQFSALGEGGLRLSNIRITATDENGESYSGLTDGNGNFQLYVPYGKYVIKANEKAVDEQFQFAQSSYTVEVDNTGGNYQLTFYLIEKRRELNIRKFDNN